MYKLILPVASFLLPAIATDIGYPAKETSPAGRYGQAIAERAPRPTPPPQARWAVVDADALFGRAASTGSDTCGYISGTDSYYPLTCGSGYTCTNSGSYRGCCEGTACSSSVGYFTKCYDSTATECSASSIGANTLCCTYSASYPYCLTYLWSTTASPGNVFTEFNCDASAFSGQYFLAAEMLSTTSTSTSSSTGGLSSSSSVDTTSTSAAAAPLQTVSSDSSSGSSSTNVGAIVGGVVGGVAVLALIGFGIWFILRKKNNSKAVAPQDAQDPQMAQSPGYQSPSPQAGSSYDPRYSYVPSQLSPSVQGYPSPSVSPVPFYAAQPTSGQDTWQGQNNEGYYYHNDNATKNAPHGQSPASYQPMTGLAEVEGEGAHNRAELA